MKFQRSAMACALALASGSALAQSSSTATTAVVADTLIQLYGHLDLSIDYATKGISSGQTNAPFGTTVADGKGGWQPAISSNLSYFGVRGGRDLGAGGLRAIFQFETQEGRGNGVLRLLPEEKNMRAWTLLTALDEIKGFEERVGRLMGQRQDLNVDLVIGEDHGDRAEQHRWADAGCGVAVT